MERKRKGEESVEHEETIVQTREAIREAKEWKQQAR